MSQGKEKVLPPLPPYRSVRDPKTGIVATVQVGSYADYLERMEAWLLQELEEAADAEERRIIKRALQENHRQRQELKEREDYHASGNA